MDTKKEWGEGSYFEEVGPISNSLAAFRVGNYSHLHITINKDGIGFHLEILTIDGLIMGLGEISVKNNLDEYSNLAS